MKVTAITILLLGLFSSSLSITISENANPSKAPIVEGERSKTQKRESSDQTAAEDKARSSVTEQNFENKQNFKESTIQYETSFIPSNSAGSNGGGGSGGQYYVSAATPQVQYAKPDINQIEFNKLEAPTSTVQYTQHYRNVLPTYQTLSYSGYHPSHAKLAPIQYITSPVSSPAPVHYATDYIAHASVPAIQYAAVAVPVGGGGAANTARVHHPVAYAPNSYINYAHQTSPAQLQLAYAVHIPQQVQQYLKQSAPGIQYTAMTGSQSFTPHGGSNSGHGVISGQASSAPTNQHYYVAAAPPPQAAAIPANIEYSQKPSGLQHQQQLYYAVVPNYHHGYQHGNGGFAIAVQQQHQPSAYQIQANKQHVLATNSINIPGPSQAQSGHVQIAQAPAILYKQQQHYVPATYVTSPAPSPAAPHNSASSYTTYSAQLPSVVPTAAAAIAHQYKSAPALTISTTSKPATIFATTTTTVSPATSGVVYQHQPNHHHHHQQQQQQQLQLQPQPQQQHPIQHRHTPRFIYASAAQTSPVYAHPPGNIHYGTHLYHPLLARSILSATPSSIGI